MLVYMACIPSETVLTKSCPGCLQESVTERYLAVGIHPLIADADSGAAILSSLSTAYDAVTLQDTEASDVSRAIGQVANQPSSCAAQEKQLYTSEIWQDHQAYWASRLRGACYTLDLPRSVNRCKMATEAVLSVPINIAKPDWQQVLDLAASMSVQPVAVLLTAFQVMTCCASCACPGIAFRGLLAILAIAMVNIFSSINLTVCKDQRGVCACHHYSRLHQLHH